MYNVSDNITVQCNRTDQEQSTGNKLEQTYCRILTVSKYAPIDELKHVIKLNETNKQKPVNPDLKGGGGVP